MGLPPQDRDPSAVRDAAAAPHLGISSREISLANGKSRLLNSKYSLTHFKHTKQHSTSFMSFTHVEA